MSGRVIAALMTALVLAGCGDDGTGTATDSPTESMTPSPTESMMHGTGIVAADSDFGTILFDSEDQAIYLFDVETTTEPQCYDACAEAWPPVLTVGDPVAGTGLEASRLGTTERSDGTTQVTYGGHPLYYYAHEGPGEVKCHDVSMNGGNWYVVQPHGERAP
jgi:predicted lipoprotein with Yx(FWY)xxD motif